MKRIFKTHFFKAFVCTVAIASATVPSVSAQTQDPLAGEVVNAIAQKTITKFQGSSCQDLATSMAQGKQDPNTLKDQITARFR